MDSDIFSAGVAPGSPSTQDEVKMLLCYILSNCGQDMSFAQLHEALSEHSLVNYFELVRTTEKLVSSGHLLLLPQPDGTELYTATEVGRQAAQEFCSVLPFTVREKSLEATRRLLKRKQREAEVQVTITPAESGFMVELTIPDQSTDLLRVQAFAPTQEQAALMRRRFLNDPQFLYQSFMALLIGDEEAVGKISPQKEKLF